MIKRKLWRLWAKALGEKASESDREADQIAMIRTCIVLLTVFSSLFGFITNIFIILAVIRHWSG